MAYLEFSWILRARLLLRFKLSIPYIFLILASPSVCLILTPWMSDSQQPRTFFFAPWTLPKLLGEHMMCVWWDAQTIYSRGSVFSLYSTERFLDRLPEGFLCCSFLQVHVCTASWWHYGVFPYIHSIEDLYSRWRGLETKDKFGGRGEAQWWVFLLCLHPRYLVSLYLGLPCCVQGL